MDTHDNRSIPEMVAQRKTLARQQSEINQKLEALDNELFARLETALAAFGIQAPAAPTSLPTPPRVPAPSAFSFPPIPAPVVSPQPAQARQKATPKPGEVGYVIQENVAALLRREGVPMSTNDLFVRLDEAGVNIPGKDKKNNLSAHLSRSEAFRRAGKGWWFAEKQEPPVGGS
jgi:hypothetical protein